MSKKEESDPFDDSTHWVGKLPRVPDKESNNEKTTKPDVEGEQPD